MHQTETAKKRKAPRAESKDNVEPSQTPKKTQKLSDSSKKASDPTPSYKIIIAGAPASGKGTQCELIKENYDVVHISTGDLLRAAKKEGTELGKQAASFMDAGKLVPDKLVVDLVKERLAQDDCKESGGFLLDGFPRTQAQAHALRDSGVVPNVLLFLEVPEEILVERVVGRRSDPVTGKIYHLKFNPPPEDPEVQARLVHRSDDTAEKAKTRIAAFNDNLAAIKGEYEDIWCRMDGNRSKTDVFADVKKFLEEKVPSSAL